MAYTASIYIEIKVNLFNLLSKTWQKYWVKDKHGSNEGDILKTLCILKY